MTQEEFDKLPLLLTRGQAASALGVNWRHVDGFVAENRLTPIKMPSYDGNKKSTFKYKIRKIEVAEIIGLKT